MKKYAELFLTFAKVGVMTFGGGMAMLPILQREVVDNKHWVNEDDLTDYFAIGQCTPGIIAVNTATFIGERLYGAAGGIIATLGVIFPSVVIISVLASIIERCAHLPVVENAFSGIQVAVCILIINSVVKLGKKSIVDKITAAVFVLVLTGSFFLDVSPVVFVIIAAFIGIGVKYKSIQAAKKETGKEA